MIMNELYAGELSQVHVDEAINELEIIRKELQAYGPENVVWEIEDLSKRPPWGNNISKDITDLSGYFVTSDGDDFLKIFMHALKRAKELNSKLEIKTI